MPETALEIEIREESPHDHRRVERIIEDAFGRSDEARLVEALRGSAKPLVALVAEHAGRAVGHVLFSPVTIESEGAAPPACGLAPVSVAPAFQGRGVGSALVRAGLERCPERGWGAAFVLGEPTYYGRFGFTLAAPHGLRYESPAFDPAFQLLELAAGSLQGIEGWVRYHTAFGQLS